MTKCIQVIVEMTLGSIWHLLLFNGSSRHDPCDRIRIKERIRQGKIDSMLDTWTSHWGNPSPWQRKYYLSHCVRSNQTMMKCGFLCWQRNRRKKSKKCWWLIVRKVAHDWWLDKIKLIKKVKEKNEINCRQMHSPAKPVRFVNSFVVGFEGYPDAIIKNADERVASNLSIALWI